jgi:hypothetical protein
LLETFPPNCAIDARQPHEPLTPDALLGWDELVLMFNHCDPAGLNLTTDDFDTTTFPRDPTLLFILAIDSDEVAGTLSVKLNRAITPGFLTCIAHGDTSCQWCMGYLPGDAGQDGVSTVDDIDTLIDSINGVDVKPEYATDANRSGLPNAQDVLRQIDLLNGAGTFADTGGPWLNKSLRSCPPQ